MELIMSTANRFFFATAADTYGQSEIVVIAETGY
jgi:hypothetical protein